MAESRRYPDDPDAARWALAAARDETSRTYELLARERAQHTITAHLRTLAERARRAPDPGTSPLTLDTYQTCAAATAIYPGAGQGQGQILYPVIGLVDEAGEVAEKALQLYGWDPDVSDGDRLHGELVQHLLVAAVSIAKALGRCKKAFRDRGGVLATEERDRVLEFLADAVDAITDAGWAAASGCSVELPPLKPGDDPGPVLAECQDALWYVATIATEAGVPLEKLGIANLDMFASRAARNVLSGSGDHR